MTNPAQNIRNKLAFERSVLASLYEDLRDLPDGMGAARRVSDAIDLLDNAIVCCPVASDQRQQG